jgi:nucleotide-binding universal stress UspA family protein
MTSISSSKKIALWAINPFEEETRPSPAVVQELKKWAEACGYAIQPIHVLYVSSIDAPPDDYGGWVKRFVPAVEAEVSNYLKGMDLPALKEPRVLVHHGVSIHSAVDALLKYAGDVKAEWVLTASKGRSGLRRMALGSFAESLLTRSPVPVWVFGHGKPVSLDTQRILFATDFSDLSKAAFEQVIGQAQKLGSSVTLFHCINLPETMVSGAGAMGVSSCFPIDEYLKDQTEWARLKVAEWTKSAKVKGVTVDFVIKQVVPNIANAIVFEAGLARAGVIALASKSGPIGASLLGSNARQVIRQSECPVWVYGPKSLPRALAEGA